MHADSDGVTPLIVACYRGHDNCTQLLLAANAAIDQADSNGIIIAYRLA